jgi:DNA polymerase eta
LINNEFCSAGRFLTKFQFFVLINIFYEVLNNFFRYRDAGKEVMKVMCEFSECVERASIDEAYLDLTKVVDDRLKQFVESGVSFKEYFNSSKFSSTFVCGYEPSSSGLETWLDESIPYENSDGFGSDDHLIDDGVEDYASDGKQFSNALRLAMGAVIIEEMRKAIYERTEYRCSAGISHNKVSF